VKATFQNVVSLIFVVGLCSSGLIGCFEPTKDTHPGQVLTKRNALFKQFNRTLAPMMLVANERNDYVKDDFLEHALDLEKLASKPWAYFPVDGNYPPTHARPSVWSRPAEFKDAQDKFQVSVTQLVATARIGDLEKIKVSVYDVSNTCKSCHKNFRFE